MAADITFQLLLYKGIFFKWAADSGASVIIEEQASDMFFQLAGFGNLSLLLLKRGNL